MEDAQHIKTVEIPSPVKQEVREPRSVTNAYGQSKLNLVNRCLRSIGEVPLPHGTDLDSLQQGIDAEIAYRVVEETIPEVLSIGWAFNTFYDRKFYPDESTNMIELEEHILRIDDVYTKRYISRAGYIYDTYNSSYEIPKNTVVTVDVIRYGYVGYWPVELYEYIALRSARKFQEFLITAAELVNVTRNQEMDAYTNLQRLQLKTRTYNIQNDRVSTRTSNGPIKRGLYRFKTRFN